MLLPSSPVSGAHQQEHPLHGARWQTWLTLFVSCSEDELTPMRSLASSATDVNDFEPFFYEYEPQISGYLRRMLGDEEAAYDISQETFLRAWQHYQIIRHYDRPVAWLFRVATNLAIKHVHRLATPIGAATALNESILPAIRDLAGDIAEAQQVRQILAELLPKQRALLMLRDVYGLSDKEAATALGMSRMAARKMLSRARAQFRTRYLQKESH
jgi:RNA polymerase sigma-70 factor (ECF subfamily)